MSAAAHYLFDGANAAAAVTAFHFRNLSGFPIFNVCNIEQLFGAESAYRF